MQLVFDHLGNVAARCSWDLRKPEDGLCQQYIWSLEEQVPWLHEWGRTNNFAHKGNRNFIHSKLKPILSIRTGCPTMPMKKTLPLWTSSLGSRLYLVSQKLELKIQTRFRPEFERSPKMTWLDFISGFGGICGLCLGISFVSLVEIAYWFTLRLCKNCWYFCLLPRFFSLFFMWLCLYTVHTHCTVQCFQHCRCSSSRNSLRGIH